MEEFRLKSELLLQAFWGGYMCKNNCLTQCHGYFNADEGDYGRGFIEYCIARVFNIHRVPGYEQYYLKDGTKMKMLHEYGNLKETDIDAACTEINLLYKFVQKELGKSNYVNNGKIRLVRSLRPFEIEAVTPQLKDPNNSTITLPVNIMTSYAHDNRLYGYGSSMSIIREVPIEKVVMFDECLFHPKNVCANSIHGGEYEVWVVEDNMFGKIKLDRACFKYERLENVSNSCYHFTQCEINASLYTDEKKPRPCEWNTFTKWLIRHNIHKIKDLYGLSGE